MDNTIRGFLSIFGGKVGSVGIMVISTPILVRILGPGSYGDFAFMTSFLSISMIFVNMGIFDSARKFIAEQRSIARWQDRVFSYYFKLSILMSGLCGVLIGAAIVSGVIARLLEETFVTYFVIVAVLVVFNQLFSLCRSSLMGINLEHYSEGLEITKNVLQGAVGVTLAYVGYSVEGVLFGYLVAGITVTTLAIYVLNDRLALSYVFTATKSSFPKTELLTFSTYTMVLVLLINTLYHFDVLLLRIWTDGETVGYYNAALIASQFVWLVPLSVQMLLVHTSSEAGFSQGQQAAYRLGRLATKYNALLTLLVAMIVAVLAEPLITIYFGTDFAPAVLPLLVLLPGVVGFALSRPIYGMLHGLGELRLLMYAVLPCALLNVVLNVALIPRYGIYGAAISTSLSYGLLIVTHVLVAIKGGESPIDESLDQIVLCFVLAGVTTWTVSRQLDPGLTSIVLTAAIGVGVYGLLVLALRIVPREEITVLHARLSD